MTTAANARRNDHVATAAQTVFPYTFEVTDQDDLVVQQNGTTLTIATHYTVSGVGNENGGSVTLVTGAALDDAIAVFSDEAIARTADYLTAGDFKATTVNAELDKIFRLLGDRASALLRTLRLSDSDPQDGATFELPIKSLRLGKVLAFNATTGIPEVIAKAEVGALTIGAAVTNFFQAATTLAAQQAIDLEPGVDVQAFDDAILKGDETNTISVGFTHDVYNLGDSGTGTFTLDHENGAYQAIRITGDCTINAPVAGDLTDGKASGFKLYILNDGTGGHTVTFGNFENEIGDSYNSALGKLHMLEIEIVDLPTAIGGARHDTSVMSVLN